MQLSSKDPDIQTILAWIRDKRIDLEPDFQRGEVWNLPKKQLLIDTILRNWQMPPIFIIVDDALMAKDVLDGHQRLTTIFQFATGEFPVDGFLHPHRDDLSDLDGYYFDDLPERQRRRFLDFSIRVFEISNHQRDEPFELFYRLNEGVKLTPAERRNTFYGELRGQVKEIVEFWDQIGLDADELGFANARLAYHDVIARTLISLEKPGLNRKLTDREITERYRSETGASSSTMDSVRDASCLLVGALRSEKNRLFPQRHRRFSKPTLFSLLYFFANTTRSSRGSFPPREVEDFLYLIFCLQSDFSVGVQLDEKPSEERLLFEFFDFYKYRSSTSVNDARALIIRDFFLNFAWDSLSHTQRSRRYLMVRNVAHRYVTSGYSGEDVLFQILQDLDWGGE